MASASEIAMSFPRSTLEHCIPLPRTSLTAVPAGILIHEVNKLNTLNPPPKDRVILYFQDTYGKVCHQAFTDPGRGHQGFRGEDPARVPGRTLALYSPMNVVQWRYNPYIYFLDNLSVIIEGKIGEAEGGASVDVQDLEWIDVMAVNWSRIGALTEEERGTWVYYESGRENGIREIWKQAAEGYKFTTFRIPELLNGTDISAVQIPSAKSGSFFYQHEDFSLWEHNWNNTIPGWEKRMVLEATPHDSTLTASPLTSLSSAFNEATNKIHVHYLTVGNGLGVVVRRADETAWGQPTLIETERIMSGSRLGGASTGGRVFVAFQIDRAGLHGLFYS